MQFITIQNQVGETIAVNPKQITLVCYGPNKTVLVHVGKDIIPTQFTDLLVATRILAGHREREIEDLWRMWGDV